MSTVMRRRDPVTARWLTERLQRAGALPTGRVVQIRERANDAFTSTAVHLTLEYSHDAPSTVPRAVFLKRMDQGWGEREVAFYRLVQDELLDVIPRCWDLAFDALTG